jgi:hypothetical protein
MAPFVLHDGSVVNSYGFRVRTAGLKFDRFDQNPVMLSEHDNRIGSVLGKWVNRKVANGVLTADADFDTEDPEAAKIKGKVERGYLKGASDGCFEQSCFCQTGCGYD